MARTKYDFLAVVVATLILVLSFPGCTIPFPELPEITVTLPSPQATANPSSDNSSSPINPSWSPPTLKNQSAQTILTIPQIVKKVTPSVVAVQTEVIGYDIFFQPVPTQGAGTGIIIDSQGYILTNNHVVANSQNVKVTLSDGRVIPAVKIRTDPTTDLAIIQVDAQNLTKADIGRSEDLVVGESVVAIGNALALDGGPTVTSGIVSYIGRSIQEPNGAVIDNLIQTDAAINPGNSGGPLLNMGGQVVGINTAVASEGQNIGFSISITPSLSIIEKLIKQGRVVRPFLGIGSATGRNGVSVTSVRTASPADRAGLKVGDTITYFAGRKVTKRDELVQAIQSQQVGDRVEIVFVRAGVEQKTSAVLVENPGA